MQVCGTPQPPLLGLGPIADIPCLMSASGTEVDVWRLGQAIERQVGPPEVALQRRSGSESLACSLVAGCAGFWLSILTGLF
jgi:hypothetical protein